MATGKWSKRRDKPTDKWLKTLERRGTAPFLRSNSLKLIANSTMVVFQWSKSRYRCFCCKKPYPGIDELRQHTNSEHNIRELERRIISQQNRLLKVDISRLNCKLCSQKLEDLAELDAHLNQKHDITFNLKGNLLVPFKIETAGLQCQICQQKFALFRVLNLHVNKHYQNHVCHVCGAGFTNLVFLNLHRTRIHRVLRCVECDVNFKCRGDKRSHDVAIHDMKIERKARFPCPYCAERFYRENFRVLHLVEKHGMERPAYKCTKCPKVFITRSLLNNHVRYVHLKERNKECDFCHKSFYTAADVTRHRVTHTGEKNFKCTLCNNAYSTRDSLRKHHRRIHSVTNK